MRNLEGRTAEVAIGACMSERWNSQANWQSASAASNVTTAAERATLPRSSHSVDAGILIEEPLIGVLYPVVESPGCFPPQSSEAADVQQFAGSSVRL